MDYNTTKQLLEKYFDGTTTLAEEAQLRDYFSATDDVDERLQMYQPWFGYLHTEQQVTLPAAVEQRIRPGRRRWLYTYHWATGVAAAVLLVLGLWWMLSTTQSAPDAQQQPIAATIDWSQYEVEDPEEAARILQQSLRKASGTLTLGAQQAQESLQRLEQ